MSLYYCIDLLEKALHPDSSCKSYFGGAKTFSEADIAFFQTLQQQLRARIKENKYAHLSEQITAIRQYIASNQHAANFDFLNNILENLQEIRVMYRHVRVYQSQETDAFSQFKIARINQCIDYRMGNTAGCYGLSLAMADPRFSPYTAKREVQFNQEIYNYQKYQRGREKDQGCMKRTRLTRWYFCADSTTQAEEILAIANQYKDKDLLLSLRDTRTKRAHACYLSIRSNGQIRYMNPNYGAYLFNHRDVFIAFVSRAAEKDDPDGFAPHFYELSELQYDEKKLLQPVNTLQGVWRSILTGGKYSIHLTGISTILIQNALAISIGTGIGALIGCAMPAIGLIYAMCAGAAIAFFVIQIIIVVAHANGHAGLLCIPHLILESCQHLKEAVADLLKPMSNDVGKSDFNEYLTQTGTDIIVRPHFP